MVIMFRIAGAIPMAIPMAIPLAIPIVTMFGGVLFARLA
jgi:hypothetical protein